VSGITAYLEGFAKIDEGLHGGREAKSQAFVFSNKKFVANNPHSQLMSSMRMRIILN
jgi:hypothetical protein